MSQPLMPRATAVWLVENTGLTFDQIADFCGLHPLEVQGIADGEVAAGIRGRDPIVAGEITREQIEAAEGDSAKRLEVTEPEIADQHRPPGPRYTPVSKRQNRPNAISWLIKHHPELTDSQICRLVGTTKPTIVSVRERSHWNSPNIKAQDPVSLGICSQVDLDEAITQAVRRIQLKEDRDARAIRKAQREKAAAEAAAKAPAETAAAPSGSESDPG